jgi:uncharacterized damage-inducible protein DinB
MTVRRGRAHGPDPGAGRRLIEVWRTNARATALLVGGLPKEIWAAAVPGAPRRTVSTIAAHLHNTRCMWLKMLGGGTKGHGVAIPKNVDARRVRQPELLRALAKSAEAIAKLMEVGVASGGEVPKAAWQNFPPDLPYFTAYFVAHEAHHRGQLCLIARQLGRRLPPEITGGIWGWRRLSRGR